MPFLSVVRQLPKMRPGRVSSLKCHSRCVAVADLGPWNTRPPQEVAFLTKVSEKPIDLWSHVKMPKPSNVTDSEWARMQKEEDGAKAKMIPAEDYRLADQVGQYAGWFGIVRQKKRNDNQGVTTLLVEHKYTDGLTDLHIQVVSIYGAGDFTVALPMKADDIPLLSLVRVYGKVSKGDDGMPAVAPEFIRVWDWGLFTFMDYGQDRTNPNWLKLRKVSGEAVYSPRPTQQFYEERLGKRETSSDDVHDQGK